MANPRERLLAHQVDACPRCGRRHRYALLVGPREGPLLFAGLREVTVPLRCPRTGQGFDSRVSIGSSEQFLRVADPHAADEEGEPAALSADVTNAPSVGVVGGAAGPVAAPPSESSEVAEWLRTSRQTATEYCRTMLTASSGAVPVHFAVLQYLDVSARSGGWAARCAALPAVFFVLAAAAFGTAQRPRLVQLADDLPAGFDALRRKTLQRIDRLARWGTALFLAGTAGALIAFTALLGR